MRISDGSSDVCSSDLPLPCRRASPVADLPPTPPSRGCGGLEEQRRDIMELRHIELSQLVVSPANMRGTVKKPDITNILPTIRARGILVPLIVRPSEAEGTYEIVAGKRRYHAALTVAEEQDGIDPLPCAVMEAGDDAAAPEASLDRKGGV